MIEMEIYIFINENFYQHFKSWKDGGYLVHHIEKMGLGWG